MGGADGRTDGRTTSVQSSEKKMEFWAEKRALPPLHSDHNNERDKIIQVR